MTLPQHPRLWPCTVVVCLLSLGSVGLATEDGNDLFTSSRGFWGTVRQDYGHLYLSRDRLIRFGVAFGVGAVMANTNLDEDIQDWYQQHVRTDGGDDASKVAKMFGEGRYLIPISVVSALVGDRLSRGDGTSPVGTWGKRAARSYLAGAPALLLTQRLTGGSRPIEGDSRWRAFEDDNGVSGHAFIGAVPFLTAGRMCEQNALARYALYVVSALPALSRINDDAHYASQAFLGWFLAWEATGAILQTDRKDTRVALVPMMIQDGYGLGLHIQW